MRPYAIVQRFGLKNPVFPSNIYIRDISVVIIPLKILKYIMRSRVVNLKQEMVIPKKFISRKLNFLHGKNWDYVDKIKKAFKL